ncbi:MAG: Eukaryotic translation initiation factor eIF2A [Fimbriimonadaceae bacterium]|jgi:WD40 repeat protein|nr:Eukaryotic translation initiation factor eIF2A [Fimbriimonadaceae bacterium]
MHGLLIAALVLSPKPPQRLIHDIAISPDDKWFAVTAATNDIWIYDAKNGTLLRTLHHKPGSTLIDIEISPDGQHLVCTNNVYSGAYAPIWSTRTWKETGRLAIWVTKSFADPPNTVEYAGNGKYLVGTTIFGHELVCWRASDGTMAYRARRTSRGSPFAVNARSTFVAIYDPTSARCRFWDFEESGRAKSWGPEITAFVKNFRTMRFSHDGARLFVMQASKDGTCDLVTFQPRRGVTVTSSTAKVERFEQRDLDWSHDDKLIFLAGLNGQILVYDPAAGKIARYWKGHGGGPIKAVSAFNQGHHFLTGANDQICMWDGDSGRLLRTFSLPPK